MKVNQRTAKNPAEKQDKKRKTDTVVAREKFQKARKALYEYWKDWG